MPFRLYSGTEGGKLEGEVSSGERGMSASLSADNGYAAAFNGTQTLVQSALNKIRSTTRA